MFKSAGSAFLNLAILFSAVPLAAQLPADRDWGAALRKDAQALHDDIAANHPGTVNPQDPRFAKRNDRQLALALRRSESAKTYGDYFYALREYVGSFNDGHMGFGAFGDTPHDFSWPGFLTDYDARDDMRIMTRAADMPLPIGAKLISCNGHPADQVAAKTLGTVWGRWQLESQRRLFGKFLFASEDNHYVKRPSACTFEVGGKRQTVTLDWKPVRLRSLLEKMDAVGHEPVRKFEARTLDNGTRWFSFPSFDGDPKSKAGQALPQIIATMRDNRAGLSAAPAIVLDLRGNSGGSSDWSHQIAAIIWGPGALDRLPSNDIYVEWRVSRTNLESIKTGYARQREGTGLSSDMKSWYETVIAGLTAALGRGDAMWRQPGDHAKPALVGAIKAAPPLAGVVYVLTDEFCASACLDAVDLWRALGALHVGRKTSADTLYMEVRSFRLPNGISGVSLPMKVYRNRPRASNEPVVPIYSFEGDISDTAALEQWIAALGASRQH